MTELNILIEDVDIRLKKAPKHATIADIQAAIAQSKEAPISISVMKEDIFPELEDYLDKLYERNHYTELGVYFFHQRIGVKAISTRGSIADFFEQNQDTISPSQKVRIRKFLEELCSDFYFSPSRQVGEISTERIPNVEKARAGTYVIISTLIIDSQKIIKGLSEKREVNSPDAKRVLGFSPLQEKFRPSAIFCAYFGQESPEEKGGHGRRFIADIVEEIEREFRENDETTLDLFSIPLGPLKCPLSPDADLKVRKFLDRYLARIHEARSIDRIFKGTETRLEKSRATSKHESFFYPHLTIIESDDPFIQTKLFGKSFLRRVAKAFRLHDLIKKEFSDPSMLATLKNIIVNSMARGQTSIAVGLPYLITIDKGKKQLINPPHQFFEDYELLDRIAELRDRKPFTTKRAKYQIFEDSTGDIRVFCAIPDHFMQAMRNLPGNQKLTPLFFEQFAHYLAGRINEIDEPHQIWQQKPHRDIQGFFPNLGA